MLVLASIVGFMGPFGTYNDEGLVSRGIHWWQLLMGAYVLIRPAIIALGVLAKKSDLPAQAVIFWGVAVTSVPLAVLWRNVGQDEFRELDGYSGLMPFSLLCALAVLGVAQWARYADKRLAGEQSSSFANPPEHDQSDKPQSDSKPSLTKRLSPNFVGDIIALQSEDHYVRVHGEEGSELILIRLRDAIAEMDGADGWQVHRSWWVARSGIIAAKPSGRSWTLRLTNGATAIVSRDMGGRLKAEGLLGQPD